MKKYVLGFAINSDTGLWLSMLNTKGPERDINRWSGIGGEIEEGETSLAAMMRESQEEIGVGFPWIRVGMFSCPGIWSVVVFRVRVDSSLEIPDVNDVGERLEWRPFGSTTSNAYNLYWLLPLVIAEYDISDFDVVEPE